MGGGTTHRIVALIFNQVYLREILLTKKKITQDKELMQKEQRENSSATNIIVFTDVMKGYNLMVADDWQHAILKGNCNIVQ